MKYPPYTDSSATITPRFDGTQACAGADQRLFFPELGGSAKAHVRAAKALCASCRFISPCLEYALVAQGAQGVYVAGIWGGTTEQERTSLRRGRGHIRHVVAA